MKRVYLSHPYGGKEENREKAAAIAKMYREIWAAEGKDYEIINPLDYLAPFDLPEWQMLRLAVDLLKSCDAVLFAPGWKHSRGCRMEHMAAFADGMKICYLPEGFATP